MHLPSGILSGKMVEFEISDKLKKIINNWPWYVGVHPDGTGLDAFRCGECGTHLMNTQEGQAGHLRLIHGYRITGEKYE